MLRSIGLPELLVIAIVFGFFFWPWARIFSKAGYSRWWCVPANIPLLQAGDRIVIQNVTGSVLSPQARSPTRSTRRARWAKCGVIPESVGEDVACPDPGVGPPAR